MPIVTDWGKRLMAILACAALAGALGLGWWANGLRAENKRLTQAVAGLAADLDTSQKLRKTDQAVATRAAARVAALTTTQRITDAKLAAALVRESSWAGTDVPPDVAAALGLQLPAHP